MGREEEKREGAGRGGDRRTFGLLNFLSGMRASEAIMSILNISWFK